MKRFTSLGGTRIATSHLTRSSAPLPNMNLRCGFSRATLYRPRLRARMYEQLPQVLHRYCGRLDQVYCGSRHFIGLPKECTDDSCPLVVAEEHQIPPVFALQTLIHPNR